MRKATGFLLPGALGLAAEGAGLTSIPLLLVGAAVLLLGLHEVLLRSTRGGA